jgi:predicted amidohydrolase
MRIAIGQIKCIESDREGNLARIENAVIEAASNNTDLIVFPESIILGWINPEAFELASPIPGRDSDFSCRLAKEYSIHICIGLDEKEGDHLFGSLLLIDNNGKILLKHRKINVLPHLMNPPYSMGNSISAVDTKFGKVGVLICADSFEDDLLTEMSMHNPNLVLIPYGWAAEESRWPAHGNELVKVVQHAAKILKCPIIGPNSIGKIEHGAWKGRTYNGQSVAVDEHGNLIAKGKAGEPDLIVIDLPSTYKLNLKKNFKCQHS